MIKKKYCNEPALTTTASVDVYQNG